MIIIILIIKRTHRINFDKTLHTEDKLSENIKETFLFPLNFPF